MVLVLLTKVNDFRDELYHPSQRYLFCIGTQNRTDFRPFRLNDFLQLEDIHVLILKKRSLFFFFITPGTLGVPGPPKLGNHRPEVQTLFPSSPSVNSWVPRRDTPTPGTHVLGNLRRRNRDYDRLCLHKNRFGTFLHDLMDLLYLDFCDLFIGYSKFRFLDSPLLTSTLTQTRSYKRDRSPRRLDRRDVGFNLFDP